MGSKIDPAHFFNVAATAVSFLHYYMWLYHSPHRHASLGRNSDKKSKETL